MALHRTIMFEDRWRRAFLKRTFCFRDLEKSLPQTRLFRGN